MIEITEEERARARERSRRMYQTDLASDLATAEDRGIEIGKRNGGIEIARRMLCRDYSIEEIAEVTDLSVADVEGLKAQERRHG